VGSLRKRKSGDLGSKLGPIRAGQWNHTYTRFTSSDGIETFGLMEFDSFTTGIFEFVSELTKDRVKY
jgi:hypothetical protein